MGRDIWTLTSDKFTTFMEVFFAFEILYTFVLAMVKISICFLYIRVFPDRKFTRVVWATQVFNLVLLIGFLIIDFAQCRPMNLFWEDWDGKHHGQCLNSNAIAWAHASINILLDFWMLALPASRIWGIVVPKGKKSGVHTMFGLGIVYVLLPPYKHNASIPPICPPIFTFIC